MSENTTKYIEPRKRNLDNRTLGPADMDVKKGIFGLRFVDTASGDSSFGLLCELYAEDDEAYFLRQIFCPSWLETLKFVIDKGMEHNDFKHASRSLKKLGIK